MTRRHRFGLQPPIEEIKESDLAEEEEDDEAEQMPRRRKVQFEPVEAGQIDTNPGKDAMDVR